jgi:hypothetical protein
MIAKPAMDECVTLGALYFDHCLWRGSQARTAQNAGSRTHTQETILRAVRHITISVSAMLWIQLIKINILHSASYIKNSALSVPSVVKKVRTIHD